GGQRALGDRLQLIDRLAGTDALDQVGVLLDIGIDVLTTAAIAPFGFPHDLHAAFSLEETFAADHGFGDVILAAGNLPAHAHDVNAVRIFVIDREVVEDLPVFGTRPHLPTAHAHRPHRRMTDRPIDYIQVVNVFLD